MSGVFVTGTGTDVGKTYVTGRLLGALRAAGVEAISHKPVQTGCRADEVAPDLAEHWRLAGWAPEPGLAEALSPFRFVAPVSPHLAASMEGYRLSVFETVNKTRLQIQKDTFSLVEGAGGVLVPLNESETMLDLMKGMGLPVLVVAAAGVGTINHTLLTLSALAGAEIHVVGVVLSVLGTESPEIVANNAETIASFGAVRVFRTDALDDLTQVLLEMAR